MSLNAVPPPVMTLNRDTIWFPLAFVLFEFAVYICNDLVQPAMLQVVQDFAVSHAWVPASMSFFLLGGACLAWFLGPLSDRLGRRPVLLCGVASFAFSCFAILTAQSIEQFILWRFLQGIGLTFIAAVGYAAIQESFAERDAIKVMALMANISLIAPLLGPVMGAWMIEYVSWHWGFIGIGFVACLSWLGLLRYMPKAPPSVQHLPIKQVMRDFKAVLLNRQFMALSLSLPMVSIPLILWIALSPVILVEDMGLSNIQYGWSQVPVLGSLIIGNLLLIRLVERLPVGRTVQLALPLMLFGACIMAVGLFLPSIQLVCLLLGMSLIAFGEGVSFAVLYRFSLMASDVAKGTVAAVVSMIMLIAFFGMIELIRVLYQSFSLSAYVWACVVVLALWFTLPAKILAKRMQQGADSTTA